jgi:solute carrier family 6 GABA transporter-like protein 1
VCDPEHIFIFVSSNYVLSISPGIDVVGGIRWELFAYLLLAWVFVYFVVWKGLHNSGKVNFETF